MFRKLFPCVLVVCSALCVSASISAQTPELKSRTANATTDSAASQRLETELSLPAPVEESRPRLTAAETITGRFNQLLLTSIQTHLGASYHFNRTGPETFDCSGFVWRTFQDAGLNFTRGPARSYWVAMPAATKEEQSKFGTLVFFSGLAHVGIVADEHGFYHASRHHGVIYSPFNDYWLTRIDGFRRVPMTDLKIISPSEKTSTSTSKGLQRGATAVVGNSADNR